MTRPGRALVVVALLGPLPGIVSAQGNVCRPGKASNEARTMAFFDVPLAFAAAAAPARAPAGRVQFGLELSYLPDIDPAIAIPTICRPDKTAPENTDLLFAFPRPRVGVTLPAGFAFEASWVPPLRMADVEANLLGVALSHTQRLGGAGRMLLELRAHGSFGTIEAPITCDDTALQDAGSPCYQGTRSNDSFKPNVMGVSGALGWTLGRTLSPYLGAGYNRLAPRFQVNFTNRFGAVDRQRVVVDLDRAVLFAGASWRPRPVLTLTGEVYSAPADAVTARVVARFQLR